METLHYPKQSSMTSKIQTVQISQVSPKYSNFAFKSFLSDTTFESASLNKEILKKNLQTKRLAKLKTQHEEAVEKVRQVSTVHSKIRKYMQQVQVFKNRQRDFFKMQEKMNDSVVLIQKVVRGFLTRKKIEERIIPVYQKILNKDLDDMLKNDRFCLFFVGNSSLEAIIVLQRFFRRCLFLKKLMKFAKAFNLLQNQQENRRSLRFHPFFLCFHCKIKVNEANEAKVLHLKLRKIRQNLAILSIKSKLKHLKLKMKTVRYRVKRYSKRFAIKEVETLFPISIEKSLSNTDALIPILKLEESVIQTEKAKQPSVDRFSHSTEFYIQQDLIKKERIDKGRIVYGIKNKSPSVLRPIFSARQEKRPQTTNVLTIRMNLVKPVRPVLRLSPKTESPSFQKSRKRHKRYSEGDSPPYMRQTENSKAKFQNTPSPENSQKNLKASGNNSIRYPTFSYAQKVKNKEKGEVKEKNKERPCTGFRIKRKVVRSKQISCASFIDFQFEPPLLDVPDMQKQIFRPFYSKG